MRFATRKLRIAGLWWTKSTQDGRWCLASSHSNVTWSCEGSVKLRELRYCRGAFVVNTDTSNGLLAEVGQIILGLSYFEQSEL
jgi:hypothetical protein